MYEPGGANCSGALTTVMSVQPYTYILTGQDYSKSDIDAAAKEALQLASQSKTLGAYRVTALPHSMR